VDHRAGDPAGAVRGQEHVAARVVLAGQRDPQRRAAAQVLLAAFGRAEDLAVQAEAARAGQLGAQRAARGDAVDPDLRGQLVRQRDHAAADGELRRDVQHAAAARVEARRGHGQHHRAACPAQLGQRGTDGDQLALHVDAEHLGEGGVELVVGEVGQAAVEVEDPHAVDQHVQAAERPGGRLDGRARIGR
jgi:hypothetical protein